MIIRRYDALSIAFHWLVALAVIATYAIGLGREILPKGDARTALLALHMSLALERDQAPSPMSPCKGRLAGRHVNDAQYHH